MGHKPVSIPALWATGLIRQGGASALAGRLACAHCVVSETDLDAIPETVASMPFDRMRHDLLMTLASVPQERILAIVDDLFMPLAAWYRPAAHG